jgi:hypothetical protein
MMVIQDWNHFTLHVNSGTLHTQSQFLFVISQLNSKFSNQYSNFIDFLYRDLTT